MTLKPLPPRPSMLETYESPLTRIFLDVMEERRRQEFLKSQGTIPFTCADAVPLSMKLMVLVEEVGEVAKAIQERNWPNLRDELVQVCAVALASIEALDAGK